MNVYVLYQIWPYKFELETFGAYKFRRDAKFIMNKLKNKDEYKYQYLSILKRRIIILKKDK